MSYEENNRDGGIGDPNAILNLSERNNQANADADSGLVELGARELK